MPKTLQESTFETSAETLFEQGIETSKKREGQAYYNWRFTGAE